MSDIEKLARLADCANELLSLRDEVQALREQVDRLSGGRVLSSAEAADVLGVSQATIVNWIHRGWIPAIMSRGGYRIPECKLFQYAEEDAARRRESYKKSPPDEPAG